MIFLVNQAIRESHVRRSVIAPQAPIRWNVLARIAGLGFGFIAVSLIAQHTMH